MKITQKLASFVFPAPRSNQTDRPPSEANNSRCQFTFSDGRQCRMQTTHFCTHHSSREKPEDRGNGFPDEGLVGLEVLCADLTNATNINRALSQVFLLTAQGRISQKQAVAFGYLSQLLLQTVPGVRSEYVSAHGYRAWEQRLKSSLEADQNEAPEPSGGQSQQPANVSDNGNPLMVSRSKKANTTPISTAAPLISSTANSTPLPKAAAKPTLSSSNLSS